MSTSSDASSEMDPDSRRSCPRCSTRMSSLANDGHSLCSVCRGQECQYDSKCTECVNWSADAFDKYIKHLRSLASKSKARKAKSEKDTKKPSGRSSGVSDASLSESGNVSVGHAGVSEDRVRALIQESMTGFSVQLSTSMEQSFGNMHDLIDKKLGEILQVRQDVSNPSISDSPSQPPIHTPLSQGHEDPSWPRTPIEQSRLGV